MRSSFYKGVVIGMCVVGCSDAPKGVDANAVAGLDALVAALGQATRARDAKAYAALHTDTVVFEWPAFNTVRGRAALEALMRSNWGPRADLAAEVTVEARRIAGSHATEFATYRESWREPTGARTTEFGRYVVTLARQPNGNWLVDRFFGFADSTKTTPTPK